MASEDGNPTAAALESFIKERFVSCDNLQRDVAWENERIMDEKASLLIEASISGGRFAPFIKTGSQFNGSWDFEHKTRQTSVKLPYGSQEHEFLFSKFSVRALNAETLAQEDGYHSGAFQPDMKYIYPKGPKGPKGSNGVNVGIGDRFNPSGHGPGLAAAEIQAALDKAFHNRSAFDLLQEFTPYDTPEKTCRFFGEDWTPYGGLKKSVKGFRLDIFTLSGTATKGEQAKLSQVPVKAEDLVSIPFKNAHGDIVQKALVIKNFSKGEKRILPLTCWMRDYSVWNRYFFMPHPKGQPLYNLDLLMKAKAKGESKTVILTDSIEIAEANQRRGAPGIIWTSWLQDETSGNPYENVDWEPLKEVGPVYLLVTNHSGKNLGQAYIDAYNLADFLEEKQGINPKFIQIESAFENAAISSVVNESVLIMETFEEFEPAYKAAVRLLSAKPTPWSFMLRPPKDGDEKLDPKVEKRYSVKSDALRYLMRPCLERGEISLLHAPTGLGKSSFAFSLCASVVSGEPLFREKLADGAINDEVKCWLPASTRNGFQKVLYLDYELGDKLEKRNSDFVLPYFPDDSTASNECIGNFIVKDLMGNSTDYSTAENQRKIIDMIESAKQEGVRGQPVDLIVFDPYTKLVGGSEDIETWKRIAPLMDRLRMMGLAILIVHHSDEDGRCRGYANKEDNFSYTIKLWREGKRKATLATPFTVTLMKGRSACVELDYAPFDVKFANSAWTVASPELTYAREFCEIVESYKSANYGRDAIAEMMGMGHDKCAKLFKKFKAK